MWLYQNYQWLLFVYFSLVFMTVAIKIFLCVLSKHEYV